MAKIRKFYFVFKIIIGISLLLLLFLWNSNFKNVFNLLKDFHWLFFSLLLIFGFFLNALSSLKWNLFLKNQGYSIPLGRLIRLYFIGKYFNNFAPSLVGGDLSRSYLLGKDINSQTKSFASVFLERFTGFIALSILAIFFGFFQLKLIFNSIILTPIILALVLVFVMSFGIFFPKFFFILIRIFDHYLPFSKRFNLSERIKKIYIEISNLNKKPKLFLSAMFLSFVFHIGMGFFVFLACLCIGFSPKLYQILFMTPIILLLNALPVSPSNIGWFEWAFSITFQEFGSGLYLGLAVALIIRSSGLLSSTVGCILFMMEKNLFHKSSEDSPFVTKSVVKRDIIV